MVTKTIEMSSSVQHYAPFWDQFHLGAVINPSREYIFPLVAMGPQTKFLHVWDWDLSITVTASILPSWSWLGNIHFSLVTGCYQLVSRAVWLRPHQVWLSQSLTKNNTALNSNLKHLEYTKKRETMQYTPFLMLYFSDPGLYLPILPI